MTCLASFASAIARLPLALLIAVTARGKGDIGRETIARGGHAFMAHGGYGMEFWADAALGTIGGVKLLQFGVYRGNGLEGWYHMLNSGYRFAAHGGSDYPGNPESVAAHRGGNSGHGSRRQDEQELQDDFWLKLAADAMHAFQIKPESCPSGPSGRTP